MNELPGNLFPRRLDKKLKSAIGAKGIWIEDEDHKRYMDASGGAIVVNAGHCRKEIADAVYQQLMSYDYIHPTMFTTEPVEQLATKLAGKAPGDINRFYFLSGGSEANETAIKLARQIHMAKGDNSKFRLVARWKSYHGLTLGALSAMGRTTFRAPFTPLLKDALHIPAPYCYRCPFQLEYPDCNVKCAYALNDIIEDAGPETISAFLAETIPGATIAASVPPKQYLKIIREICDAHDVLLILDEVMCGMGRTGKWFACDHYDVVPDIMTLGKGLAGGAIALSALGVRECHFNSVKENLGAFVHGGTFSHHPVAAAAGLALFDILERESLVKRAADKGERLGRLLTEKLLPLDCVGDIRGTGFFWGIELVSDKKTTKPFDRSEKVTERLWNQLFQKGFIIYPATGLAGTHGDAFTVAPPYTISNDEIDLLVNTLESTFIEFFK